ncbi:MAG TPA: PAS domain S-box protein [Bacillota bacterium]|nr:PAS domain S-box protein [Bacillota bacterium]HOL11001.1 PAS domain S-box protein [Bacillota bacterium]HPO98605.1 PAS domain S-box protein [Bacillota bacterium]
MLYSLVNIVKKKHLNNLIIYSLIVYLLLITAIWNYYISSERTNLLYITEVIKLKLNEIDGRLADDAGRQKMLDELKQYLSKLVATYSKDYTVGFNSNKDDKVITVCCSQNTAKIESFRSNDPGQRGWRLQKPQYAILWSKLRGAWLLKCDNPVIVNNEVIGHTFANITLNSIILLFFEWGLGIAVILFLAGCFSSYFMKGLIKKLEANISKLVLSSEAVDPVSQFDFCEFESIARQNFRLFNQLSQREEFQSDLLNYFPWGYTMIDSSGICWEMNENGALSLGLNKDDIVGKPITQLGLDNQIINQAIEELEVVKGNFNYPLRDSGKSRTFYSCCFPTTLNSGIKGVMVWFIDITDNLTIEHSLAKSNQLIKDILESITDSFFALNEDWCFTYVNMAALSSVLAKDSNESFIGKNIWEVYPELVDTKLYEYYQKAMREKVSIQFEFKSVYQDNSWLDIHLYPNKEGISVYVRDITEKKVADKERSQLAAIVDSSDDAIFSMSLTGTITSWNSGAEKMYGYTRSEIVGKNVNILVPPDKHDFFADFLANAARDVVFNYGETIRVCKDGTLMDVSIKYSLIKDSQGNIVGVSAIHRDITDKKRYEERLKVERERLMVTLDSISNGVIATNLIGEIIWMNHTAERLTGWNYPDWLEQPLERVFYIINNKTSEPYFNLVDKVSGLVEKMILKDVILVDINLNEIPVSVSCSPIKSMCKSNYGAVFVFDDITDKLRTEFELSKKEKLEALGILAGGIAHDFNNFLAAILTNLQLASAKYLQGNDIQKYLKESIDSTYKASELTKQLLTFSRGGAPVKKMTSLENIIKDTARFVLRGSNVKAEYQFVPDLWPIEADEGQISQVIQNLIINGKQAMPRGGTIKISGENVELQNDDGHLVPGKYVKIVIEDEGVGIPEHQLNKIFDPFFTTKSEGSGLGLTTSYSIIRRHEGYIEVDSTVGKGTTFTILLPASQDKSLVSDSTAEVAAVRKGVSVLFMDDEESILKAMGELLEYHGFKVTLTRDGAETIEVYQQALQDGKPFDVVIMDLTVPGGMGGQETITYLRDINPNIKAIVSSGYANDPIVADYERYGFSGVVIKPYKHDELIAVLAEILTEPPNLKLNYTF